MSRFIVGCSASQQGGQGRTTVPSIQRAGLADSRRRSSARRAGAACASAGTSVNIVVVPTLLPRGMPVEIANDSTCPVSISPDDTSRALTTGTPVSTSSTSPASSRNKAVTAIDSGRIGPPAVTVSVPVTR